MSPERNVVWEFVIESPLYLVALCLLTQVAVGQTVAPGTIPSTSTLPFGSRGDFDRQLSVLANHIPNRYTLTFRPTSSEPGFHALKVRVIHQPGTLKVRARESYWSSGPAQ